MQDEVSESPDTSPEKETEEQINNWIVNCSSSSQSVAVEIMKLSQAVTKFINSLYDTSVALHGLSKEISLPDFMVDFSLKFLKKDPWESLRLTTKLEDLAIRVQEWNVKAQRAKASWDEREHFKQLYEKILVEQSKLTQDHRIQEMEEIKGGVWNNFINKDKDFEKASYDAKESTQDELLGPIAEMIWCIENFTDNLYEDLDGLKENTEKYIEITEDRDTYPKVIGFSQISLEKKHISKTNLFKFNRKYFFVPNAEALFDFSSVFPDEINLKAGEAIEIRGGTTDHQWYRCLNIEGNNGFVPKNIVKLLTNNIVDLKIDDINSNFNVHEFSRNLNNFYRSIQDATQHIFIPIKLTLKDISAKLYRKITQCICRFLEIGILTKILKEKIDDSQGDINTLVETILNYCGYLYLFKSLKSEIYEVKNLLPKYDLNDYKEKIQEIIKIETEGASFLFDSIKNLITKHEINGKEKTYLHTSLELLAIIMENQNKDENLDTKLEEDVNTRVN